MVANHSRPDTNLRDLVPPVTVSRLVPERWILNHPLFLAVFVRFSKELSWRSYWSPRMLKSK